MPGQTVEESCVAFFKDGGMLAFGDRRGCSLCFVLICSSFNFQSDGNLVQLNINSRGEKRCDSTVSWKVGSV